MRKFWYNLNRIARAIVLVVLAAPVLIILAYCVSSCRERFPSAGRFIAFAAIVIFGVFMLLGFLFTKQDERKARKYREEFISERVVEGIAPQPVSLEFDSGRNILAAKNVEGVFDGGTVRIFLSGELCPLDGSLAALREAHERQAEIVGRMKRIFDDIAPCEYAEEGMPPPDDVCSCPYSEAFEYMETFGGDGELEHFTSASAEDDAFLCITSDPDPDSDCSPVIYALMNCRTREVFYTGCDG